ncbi:MAG: ABC transporter permease [Candidatus Micrarchaeales archaeon]|nr:ABC transporter permease [Candidatus Micrarchaeales archaeon]
MGELNGLYALWYREFKVFLRERSRIISSLIQPIMWLVIFGTGLGASISLGGGLSGINYQAFIYPGILCMIVLFSSLFFGLYIIMDKRVDFLKEVLVAPLGRTTIFFGKVLGGATDGLIQVALLIALGAAFFSIPFTAYSLVMTIIVVMLLLISIVSLGLAIGALMSSPEGFGLITGFVIFPLFFLSGALFPTKSLPAWLGTFVALNPVSYAVDALRNVILGVSSTYGLAMDFAVLFGFALIMIIVGTWAFRRMKF